MYTSTIDVKSCAKIIIDLALLKSKGIYNLGARNMMSKKFCNSSFKSFKFKNYF